MKNIKRKVRIVDAVGLMEFLGLTLLAVGFWFGMGNTEISGFGAFVSAVVVITSTVISGYTSVFAEKNGWLIVTSLIPVLVVGNAFIWRFCVSEFEGGVLILKSFLISVCEIFAAYFYFRMIFKESNSA
jgi:hypothetical protein